jgi:glycerophosphoryl diester phosphodiesterase
MYSLDAEGYGKLLRNNPLLDKLVLHRGWHSVDTECRRRPLENTRQAYLDAVKSGAPWAECDVYPTKDGILVLCHDPSFAAVAADPHESLAMSLIAELDWSELSQLRLKDGSTPVKLEDVLKDLFETEMQLVVELKTSDAALVLGRLLSSRHDLVASIAWVMSFSFAALECFVENGGREADCRIMWLTDNPREAYSEICEGETTFDCTSETLASLLDRLSITERFRQSAPGLYIQYNPRMSPSHLSKLRCEAAEIYASNQQNFRHGNSSSDMPLIGLWSDALLDKSFDRAEELARWVEVVDMINTDFPTEFFPSVARHKAVRTLQISSQREQDDNCFSQSGDLSRQSTETTADFPSNAFSRETSPDDAGDEELIAPN